MQSRGLDRTGKHGHEGAHAPARQPLPAGTESAPLQANGNKIAEEQDEDDDDKDWFASTPELSSGQDGCRLLLPIGKAIAKERLASV